MGNISGPSSLRFAQLLAAHMGSYVHLYEANIITNGEVVVEVCKQARGMENLHSLLPTCGAILAAALSCSMGPGVCVCVYVKSVCVCVKSVCVCEECVCEECVYVKSVCM